MTNSGTYSAFELSDLNLSSLGCILGPTVPDREQDVTLRGDYFTSFHFQLAKPGSGCRTLQRNGSRDGGFS